MKYLTILALLVFTSVSFASDNGEGEALYKQHCVACHGVTNGMEMTQRLAPPIMGVRMHYIGAYPDEASFVAAVSEWVVKPDESKTRMRGAIRRFKIMPTLGISRSDAEKIAAYMYAGDLETPDGLAEHVEERHGKGPIK